MCSVVQFFIHLAAITQAELMEELAPHVAPRWYMLAVLLKISKPILNRVCQTFIATGNVDHSLSEVLEAWLEEINVAGHGLASTERPRESIKVGEPYPYWLQIYHVIKRMGYVTFARDLDAKHSKLTTYLFVFNLRKFVS